MTNIIIALSEFPTMPIAMQGSAVNDYFTQALHAIMNAKKEGRITEKVAADRLSYLTSRFDSLTDPLQQAAACQVMIETCQRAEHTVHILPFPGGAHEG